MDRKIKGISRLAVATILGIFALLLTGCGWRYGHHMMGPGGRAGGYHGNLSAGEAAKRDQQRAEFFKATEDIRQQLHEKELALQNELARENPDTNKASSLQSEISKLRSDLDQKRLDYEIQTGTSEHNYNRRSGGYGPMRGYDHRGDGYHRW